MTKEKMTTASSYSAAMTPLLLLSLLLIDTANGQGVGTGDNSGMSGSHACVFDHECMHPDAECRLWTHVSPPCKYGFCVCREGYVRTEKPGDTTIRCSKFILVGEPCSQNRVNAGLDIWPKDAVCRYAKLICPETPIDLNKMFTIPEWKASEDRTRCYQDFTKLNAECFGNHWCDLERQRCNNNGEGINTCQCRTGYKPSKGGCEHKTFGDSCEWVSECRSPYADGQDGKQCLKGKCECSTTHDFLAYALPPPSYYTTTFEDSKCFHVQSTRAKTGEVCNIQYGATWANWRWWEKSALCEPGAICTACPEDQMKALPMTKDEELSYMKPLTRCRTTRVLDKLTVHPGGSRGTTFAAPFITLLLLQLH